MNRLLQLAVLTGICVWGLPRAGHAQPGPSGYRIARLPAVESDPPTAAADPPAAGPTGDPDGVHGSSPETLESAWAQAMAVDQTLKANAAQLDAVSNAVDAARAQRMPLLGLSAGYLVRDNEPSYRIESPLLPFSFTTPYLQRESASFEGRVDVPVYTGGRVTSEIGAAECTVAAAQHRLDRYRLDLKLRVAEEYVAVLRAEQELAVATSHERSLAAHAHDIQLLHEQQRVPLNDLLAAEVALSDARHQAIKAGSDLDACRAAYNRRLGRPLTAPVQLAALAVDTAEHDIDAQTAQALAARPELAEVDAQAAAYRYRAESAAAARRPQVHLQGAYTFQENAYQTPEGITSAGVGVWWNLHDGGRARSQTSEQANQARAMAHLRADAQSIIQLEVRQAWLAVQETRDRLAVTRQSIQRAEENLRVTRERYGSGMATNTDVLHAESLRIQTYRNHNNAVYDAALADIKLQRAVGAL